MKKIIALALVAFASPALSLFAGEPVVSSKNVVEPPPPVEELYRAHEFQVDLFGAYAVSPSDAGRYLGDHAWGGGVATNYFITRNFGLGFEGAALRGTGSRGDGNVSGQFALDVLGRLPIGSTPWAPYAIAGIGGFVPGSGSNFFNTTVNAVSRTVRDNNNDDILLEGHVGLGVEYRFTKNIGVFTDGRYTFVDKSKNDFGLVRAGVRFAF
jgi:opacity protein-like surface antigen